MRPSPIKTECARLMQAVAAAAAEAVAPRIPIRPSVDTYTKARTSFGAEVLAHLRTGGPDNTVSMGRRFDRSRAYLYKLLRAMEIDGLVVRQGARHKTKWSAA